jgi:hypothetical protein
MFTISSQMVLAYQTMFHKINVAMPYVALSMKIMRRIMQNEWQDHSPILGTG